MSSQQQLAQLDCLEKAYIGSLCEFSLYHFVKEFWSSIDSTPYIDNWHIQAICEHLEAVTKGQIENLLINIPPGMSKSLLCAVFWPTWEWISHPEIRIFCASYDQQLSTRDSLKCRKLIESNLYQEIWGDRFSFIGDQNQKTYYQNDKGGWRMATSIRGHGTGEHPHRVIIDDPHNVEQAESEVERQAVIDWWDLTMTTRGMSAGVNRRTVIIMQRLNERDLSGHILQQGGFEHICLPMRFEPNRMKATGLGFNDPRKQEGELLCPNQFPEETVSKIETKLGSYGAAGQLQQSPKPRGGGMFKPHYFNNEAKIAPYDCRRIRYIDRAATHLGGCFTAMTLLGESKDGRVFVEHVDKGQWEPNERNDRIVARAHMDLLKYGPQYTPLYVIEGERGSTGKESYQRLFNRLRGIVRCREDLPTGSKDVRAEPWSDALASGVVWLVRDGTWDVLSYIQEHLSFAPDPKLGKRLGSFKDQVDSSSGAYNLLCGKKKLTGVMRVLTSQKRTKGQRVLVLDYDSIQTFVMDNKCLLVSIDDPEPLTQEKPKYAFSNILDSLNLLFADLSPEDCLESWEEEQSVYNRKPDTLVMTQEQGKTLWKFLFKKRVEEPEVYVFQDNGDSRALSMALAFCHVLRWEYSKTIYIPSDPDRLISPEEVGGNKHVFNMTKMSRGLIGV